MGDRDGETVCSHIGHPVCLLLAWKTSVRPPGHLVSVVGCDRCPQLDWQLLTKLDFLDSGDFLDFWGFCPWDSPDLQRILGFLDQPDAEVYSSNFCHLETSHDRVGVQV